MDIVYIQLNDSDILEGNWQSSRGIANQSWGFDKTKVANYQTKLLTNSLNLSQGHHILKAPTDG